MLDEDLAQLYGVETRRPTEQVKRSRERFPTATTCGRHWRTSRRASPSDPRCGPDPIIRSASAAPERPAKTQILTPYRA